MNEDVTKLEIDKSERFERRSFEPHVQELLDEKAVDEDSEDTWIDSKEGNKKAKVIMAWCIIVAITFFCAAVGIVVIKGVLDAKKLPTNIETVQKPELFSDDKEVKEVMQKIESSLKGFFSATTVEEMSKHVRYRDRVKPLMVDYYARNELKVVEMDYIDSVSSVTIDGETFTTVNLLRVNSSPELILVKEDDGVFYVDWESLVKYNPMTWDDFIGSGLTTPLDMRIYIEIGQYYVGAYRDETKYQCFKITSFDSDKYIYGYAERGSDAEVSIRKYFLRLSPENRRSPQAMILKLRFPENGGTRKALIIDEMLIQGWTYNDTNLNLKR